MHVRECFHVDRFRVMGCTWRVHGSCSNYPVHFSYLKPSHVCNLQKKKSSSAVFMWIKRGQVWGHTLKSIDVSWKRINIHRNQWSFGRRGKDGERRGWAGLNRVSSSWVSTETSRRGRRDGEGGGGKNRFWWSVSARLPRLEPGWQRLLLCNQAYITDPLGRVIIRVTIKPQYRGHQNRFRLHNIM